MTVADYLGPGADLVSDGLITANLRLWNLTAQLPFERAIAAGHLPVEAWSRYVAQNILLCGHEEKALRKLLGHWQLPRELTDILRELAAGCRDGAATMRRQLSEHTGGGSGLIEEFPATLAFGWWMQGVVIDGTELESLAMFAAIEGSRARKWGQIGAEIPEDAPYRLWAERCTSPDVSRKVSGLTAWFDRRTRAAQIGGGSQIGDLSGVFRQALLCDVKFSQACFAGESWVITA